MLKLKKISKSFGDHEVLSDVSFEVESNSVIGLLGPNGAGKTTLMRIITGGLEANSGKVLWDGKVVKTSSMKHKHRIGYLPENNPLYGSMNPGEYLNLVAELKEVSDRTEAIIKVAKACGIADVLNQKIETLSKGYKQRVGLAGALLGKPQLLILDEPTSGLDPNQIIEIRNLIKKLAKDKIVIISTHILPEAREICSQLLIINRGMIVLNEKTDKIVDLEKKFVELTP